MSRDRRATASVRARVLLLVAVGSALAIGAAAGRSVSPPARSTPSPQAATAEQEGDAASRNGLAGSVAHTAAGGEDLCLACHAEIEEQHGAAVPHAVGDDGCVACHDPHVARFEHLLRREPRRLCTGCHTELRGELRQAVVHRAVDDERSCLACHAPHGSAHTGLLRQPEGELCLECHASIGERIAQEVPHLPAMAGDCSSCHQPHAGETLALLAAAPPELCESCHTIDAALTASHSGFALDQADCGSCHDPHGAAAAGLMRPVSHAPMESGDCSLCHADPAVPTNLTDTANATCEMCHDAYRDSTSAMHHPVTEDTGCVDCHSPHAGEAPGLMAGPQRGVCLNCHADLREAILTSVSHHPVALEEGACSACHRVHGAQAAGLLHGAETSLCESCHTDHSRFAHPMGENVADPLRPGKSLTCLSCHDTHASDHEMMLTAEEERSLCVQCHSQLH